MSAYYPVFVDVKKRRCIVIGGGTQGAEKVHKLLDCDANVIVISPEVEEEIILSELNDEDLVTQMHDDLYDGLDDEIVEGMTSGV